MVDLVFSIRTFYDSTIIKKLMMNSIVMAKLFSGAGCALIEEVTSTAFEL